MSSLRSLGARFSGIRFSRQLLIAFGALLALTAMLSGVAFVGMARVGKVSDQLGTHYLPTFDRLAAARTAMLATREFEVKHSRAADSSYHAEYEDKLKEQAHEVRTALDEVGRLQAASDDASKLTEVLKEWTQYEAAQRKVIDLGRSGKQQDAADVSDGVASTTFDAAVTVLDKLTRHIFEDGKAAGNEAAAIYRQTLWALAALLGAALLFGGLLAWGILRSVVRQLGGEPSQASAAVQAIATGDLSRRIEVAPGLEDSLMGRIGQMQTGLAAVVRRVRENADGVATASREIASGNLDLSQRTEQQASSLQQTASAMKQLGAMVSQNAGSAVQANELAGSASGVASSGGELARQVVDTMREIDDSSRRIADIIGVIDGIAFQTNILALNAAVEAARAGEQGRGFAVVAGEVRSLAQRSADAAKEIKSLIGASVERVQRGTELVNRSGATMNEIVDAIRRVSHIIGEISHASEAQSSDVGDVGSTITQMDHATQHNAALVEQTAAAAESLKHQAEELVQAVAVFRLEGGAGR